MGGFFSPAPSAPQIPQAPLPPPPPASEKALNQSPSEQYLARKRAEEARQALGESPASTQLTKTTLGG